MNKEPEPQQTANQFITEYRITKSAGLSRQQGKKDCLFLYVLLPMVYKLSTSGPYFGHQPTISWSHPLFCFYLLKMGQNFSLF